MTPQPIEKFTSTRDQIRALTQNDEQALSRFYQENFRSVEKYVLDNKGSREEAKDIYQEAFLAVWRNIMLNRFEEKTSGSLNGYLFSIARNKWLDHLRSAGYRFTVPLKEPQEELAGIDEYSLGQDDEIRRLMVVVGKLGSNCQDLLKKFYFHRESMSTIASAFGWTAATARNNKYRCIQQLKELFHNNPHG